MSSDRRGASAGLSWWLRNEHHFALAILTALTAVFSTIIYRLPLSAYIEDLNVDDSFYYYVIARHFAHGLFSTFDGINRTNGYHPLWAALLVPVFAMVRDPIAALRVAKLEEIMLLAIAAAFIMTAGRNAGWRFFANLIIPVFIFGTGVFYLGLEVSVQVALLALLMYLLSRLFESPGNRLLWSAIAADCALLPWARLECIAASFMAATLISIYLMWRRESTYGRLLAVWGSSIAGAVVYFVYNEIAFGTIVPVSGQVKSYWSKMQFEREGGFHLAVNALTFLRHNRYLSLAVVLCLAIVVMSWRVPAYRTKTYAANHGIDAFIVVLACTHAARLAFSILSLDIIYDNAWYYVPAYLLLALSVPLGISRFHLVLGLLNKRKVWSEPIIAVAALTIVIFMIRPGRALATWRGPARATWAIGSYEGVQWMNANLPAGVIIGSTDSGVLGYFSNHPVVNLDGLVNSKQYLAAIKSQSVEAFIIREHVVYLANPMWTNMTGCEFMAAATAQAQPLTAPCVSIYTGERSWDDHWSGKSTPMRFRVLGYSLENPFQTPDSQPGVREDQTRAGTWKRVGKTRTAL